MDQARLARFLLLVSFSWLASNVINRESHQDVRQNFTFSASFSNERPLTHSSSSLFFFDSRCLQTPVLRIFVVRHTKDKPKEKPRNHLDAICHSNDLLEFSIGHPISL